jgi:NTP pyrophosphatase (non-canonical NTP hydrolase)
MKDNRIGLSKEELEESPNIEDVMACFNTLLTYATRITEGHIRKRGGKTWSYDSQIARMHEEVSEVYRAMRKNEGNDRVTHETIDVIWSAFTLLAMHQLTYHDLEMNVNNVCLKLEKRVGVES